MTERLIAHNITALFGGVGGLELGLKRSGHTTSLFCECDPEAVSVLSEQFPDVTTTLDVRRTDELVDAVSTESDLLTAGFPCTDFSQAGRTQGFEGGRSSLILDTLSLLKKRSFANVLLENVPNWRQLHKGVYMTHVVNELEALGYRWAYRTIDARSFGLPQRRLRLFLYACQSGDPREVLFHGNCEPDTRTYGLADAAHGFYWTEGNRGLGWGEDCVPTLKGGSTLAIPSPPAILLKDGSIITPDIRDVERLQGFPAGWTDRPERIAAVGSGPFRQRKRWQLVGNAINVEVAHWVGQQLACRSPINGPKGKALGVSEPWPKAAWFDGKRRYTYDVGSWPVRRPSPGLEEFLQFSGQPLSLRATAGFHDRIRASSLRFKPGFVEMIANHRDKMGSVELSDAA